MPIKLYNAAAGTPEKKVEARKVYIRLAEAYVFGEKIVDAKYKNTMMRTLLAAIGVVPYYPGSVVIGIIYKGTPSTSPFRRFIADIVAYHSYDDSDKGGGWMNLFDLCPKEALVDAIKVTVKARSIPRGNTSFEINSYFEEEEQEKLEEEGLDNYVAL